MANASIIINNITPLQEQFVKENETYIISSKLNLNTEILEVPQNCTLKFEKGLFYNGKIIGSNTRILAPKMTLFENVEISGVWNNRFVYSEWVGLEEGADKDNKVRLKTLMTLCKGDVHKNVYIQSGCFWTSVNEYSCAFSIPSNTTLHCNATIRELPNNYRNACLIFIHKVSDVTLVGGNYIGDLENHIGDEGEWSHGIEIRGSTNITVKNVKCSYFWGDGIDIIEGFNDKMEPVFICKNVTILQSESSYNRRQGLSIEAVDGCLIRDCNFSFTGRYKSTPPSAGIDIEAWAANSEKIKNVCIEDCRMEGNMGPSFQSYANAVWGKDFASYKNSILLVNCTMEDIAISHTNGIELKDCIFDKIKYEKQSQSVVYTKCNRRSVADKFCRYFRDVIGKKN